MTKPRDLTRLIDPESAATTKALLPKEPLTPIDSEPLIEKSKEPKSLKQGRGGEKKEVSSPVKKALVTRRNIAFDEKAEENLLRIKKHLFELGFSEIDNQKTVEIALAAAFKNVSSENVLKLYMQILAKDSRRKPVTPDQKKDGNSSPS